MMVIDLIAGIDWRDVILVVAAITCAYLMLLLLSLFKLTEKSGAKNEAAPRRWYSGWEPYSPQQGPALSEPAVAAESEFSRELTRTTVEAELERLRRECAQLREELLRVAEEVNRLKANRNVSPLYNEATALAQQGMPAAGIAGHCGISIGEAELVAALARGGTDFGQHEQGEDRDERNTGSR